MIPLLKMENDPPFHFGKNNIGKWSPSKSILNKKLWCRHMDSLIYKNSDLSRIFSSKSPKICPKFILSELWKYLFLMEIQLWKYIYENVNSKWKYNCGNTFSLCLHKKFTVIGLWTWLICLNLKQFMNMAHILVYI